MLVECVMNLNFTFDVEVLMTDSQYLFTIALNGSYPVVRWTDYSGTFCRVCPAPATFDGEYGFMNAQRNYSEHLRKIIPSTHISIKYICYFNDSPFDCVVYHSTDDGRITYSPFTNSTIIRGNVTLLEPFKKGYSVSLLSRYKYNIQQRWSSTLLRLNALGNIDAVTVKFWYDGRPRILTTCIVDSPSTLKLYVALIGNTSEMAVGTAEHSVDNVTVTVTSSIGEYMTCYVKSSLGWTGIVTPPYREDRTERHLTAYTLPEPTTQIYDMTLTTLTTYWLFDDVHPVAIVVIALTIISFISLVLISYLLIWVLCKKYMRKKQTHIRYSRAYALGSTIHNSFRRST